MRDWRTYTVHDDKNVKGFFGDFRFLSNFAECPNGVWICGLCYNNSEAAYQAQKVIEEARQPFTTMSGKEAKKAWKQGPLIYHDWQWDQIKTDIMLQIIFNKFANNKDLRQALLDTRPKYLEEMNSWSDVFWGTDPDMGGKNMLGRILMNVRDVFVGLS